MATVPGVTVPVTVDYHGTLCEHQQQRAEALRVAANVLAGRNIIAPQAALPASRTTDDVTALAQWLLDGSSALSATLESFDTHSGESDEPVRTVRLVTVDLDDLTTVVRYLGQSTFAGDTDLYAYHAWSRLDDVVNGAQS